MIGKQVVEFSFLSLKKGTWSKYNRIKTFIHDYEILFFFFLDFFWLSISSAKSSAETVGIDASSYVAGFTSTTVLLIAAEVVTSWDVRFSAGEVLEFEATGWLTVDKVCCYEREKQHVKYGTKSIFHPY